MVPGQFADVNESVHAAEINECTESDNTRNNTFTDIANLEISQEAIAGFLLSLFEVGTT